MLDKNNMDIVLYIVLYCLIGVGLVWIGKVFYALTKGFNEIITALNSLEERIASIEEEIKKKPLK